MDNIETISNITEQSSANELPGGDGVIVISPEGLVMSANLQAEKILMMRIDQGQSSVQQAYLQENTRNALTKPLRQPSLRGGHMRISRSFLHPAPQPLLY